MTREEFETLCEQKQLVETDSASVEIQHDDQGGVYLTVAHKRLEMRCEAYHLLSDEEFLTDSVDRFAKFIQLTADVLEEPETF